MSNNHTYETAKGRFNVDIEVKQKPRVNTDVLDSRGLPKTKADSTSNVMVNCIGLKWSPNGDYTMESDPSDVLACVEAAQKAHPTLALHHMSFYDLGGASPLVLSSQYKRTLEDSKCPKLLTSDRAGSSAPTDSDSGKFSIL